MLVPFSAATAEQVVSAVEAVMINHKPTTAEFVAEFCDLPKDQAEAALKLATDLQLLSHSSSKFNIASLLCKYLVAGNQMQKAAVMRIVLEAYQPFLLFRERLIATTQPSTAARETKVVLGLDAHREDIKDTLISLGTYSHALVTEGGGRYRGEEGPTENVLEVIAIACRECVSAENRVREQLGSDATTAISRDEVIVPLSDGLVRAGSGDSRGAVVSAGNAVESFLDAIGTTLSVPLTGAPGINAKLEKFQLASKIPKKLVQVGKYLGHIRNAADHGIDADLGAAWSIRRATGIEFVYVACSFISAVVAVTKGKPPEI